MAAATSQEVSDASWQMSGDGGSSGQKQSESGESMHAEGEIFRLASLAASNSGLDVGWLPALWLVEERRGDNKATSTTTDSRLSNLAVG